MLTKILNEFKNADSLLDLKQLSQKLDVSPSALQGMLDHLVRIGKLEKALSGPDCETICSQCSQTDCELFKASQTQYRWRLPQ